MDNDNRIFVGWKNGDYIVLGLGFSDDGPDFQLLVNEHGPPDVVEFRAAGEGYISPDDPGLWLTDDEDSEADEVFEAPQFPHCRFV